MIRTESEYNEVLSRIAHEGERLKETRAQLIESGFSKNQIKRALDPLRSFSEQLKEEVESYERLKRGEFDELRNFEGVGRLLIALRIAKGLSQRELAVILGVNESQVSRDERNEYHGVTVERANRILGVLGVEIRSFVASIEPVSV